jgi:ribosomal-protein-alanine N-acetyltransferase
MIRTMTPADRPAVRRLQDRLAYADPDLVAAAAEGPFLGRVAVDDGRIVGYAIALPARPMTLSELVVAPSARRNGYGRALVESVGSDGADRIVATTPVENGAALRFYGAVGFDPESRVRGFYDDGADALRLVRRE